MGEIAEAMLEGVFCSSCGEVFDNMLEEGAEAPGYPRMCPSCERIESALVREAPLEERKPVTCRKAPGCGKRFATADAMEQHYAAKHGRRHG